ncbi:MAG: alpha/beta hydrolase [Bacteroidales bacterium]
MKSIFTFILLFFCLTLHGQERYVNIDGQKFRIKEYGVGEKTVIFESGMCDSLEAWGSIPDSVALFARVFLYDRADFGKSDTSRQKRTIPNIVLELKSILNHENICPPYILVGHSMGGLITRYFTSLFPSDVKGLLLLDPTPEAYVESLSKRDLKNFIKFCADTVRITYHNTKYWKESDQLISNLVYMKKLNISKDLPIILVSASKTNLYKFQKEEIIGLKNARQIELIGGHYIYRDHTDLIVKYIKELTSLTKD